MKIETNEIYTTKEVAELLKISLPTVKRMLKDGRLPSVRIGKQHRFLGSNLLEILKVKEEPGSVKLGIETLEKAAERQNQAEMSDRMPVGERTRIFLHDKKAFEPVYGQDGQLLVAAGTVVTDEIIDLVHSQHRMSQLIKSIEPQEEP